MSVVDASGWAVDVCAFINAFSDVNKRILGKDSISEDNTEYARKLETCMRDNAVETSKALIKASIAYEKLYSYRGRASFDFDSAVRGTSKDMQKMLGHIEVFAAAVGQESERMRLVFEANLPDNVNVIRAMMPAGPTGEVFDIVTIYRQPTS